MELQSWDNSNVQPVASKFFGYIILPLKQWKDANTNPTNFIHGKMSYFLIKLIMPCWKSLSLLCSKYPFMIIIIIIKLSITFVPENDQSQMEFWGIAFLGLP